MSLADGLAEHSIRLRSYRAGDQKTTCPQCSALRAKRHEPCLSVKIDERGATWNCKHCGWTGAVNESSLPELEHRPAVDLSTVELHPLTDMAVDWFRSKRGLSRETLERAGVALGRTWFPTLEHQSKVDCLAFPYRIPGGKIVKIKYRRASEKAFAQERGGQSVFYGLDQLDPSESAIVICEGEIDKLSIDEAGIMNALSIPDGAPSKLKDEPSEDDRGFLFLASAQEELKAASKIVLAGDNDEPGQILTEELARRIGRDRCWLVTWPEGCKDANDVLLAYGPERVRQCIEAAEPYPVRSLHGVEAYEKAVIDLYRVGRKRGHSTGFASLDPYYTVAEGQLTVVTGVPNSGKSEFVDAIMVNLAMAHDWKFAICSFENPPEEHITKLAEKYLGKPFWDGPTPRMTELELANAMRWVKDHFLFIRADGDGDLPTVEWLLEAAGSAVLRYGVNGLVIDPYNELEHRRARGSTETEYISWMLAQVKRFSRNHGVHCWYVAHPAKMHRDKEGEVPVPTLYDISSSAHWANKADVGMVIHRDYNAYPSATEIHIKKVRFKWVGKQGSVTLNYDVATGIYSDQPETIQDDAPIYSAYRPPGQVTH